MKVLVNMKKAGSKRMALTKIEYELPFSEGTLEDIIAFFVETEVKRYNNSNDSMALKYLSEKDINDDAIEGKISFNEAKTNRKANALVATENALLCYKDGLIRVFLNDNELTDLNKTITIQENDTFTFIRLSFLTGRSW